MTQEFTVAIKSLVPPEDIISEDDKSEFGMLSFFGVHAISAKEAGVRFIEACPPEYITQYEAIIFNTQGLRLLSTPLVQLAQLSRSEPSDESADFLGEIDWPAWFYQNPGLVLNDSDQTIDGELAAAAAILALNDEPELDTYIVEIGESSDSDLNTVHKTSKILALAGDADEAESIATEWYRRKQWPTGNIQIVGRQKTEGFSFRAD